MVEIASKSQLSLVYLVVLGLYVINQVLDVVLIKIQQIFKFKFTIFLQFRFFISL